MRSDTAESPRQLVNATKRAARTGGHGGRAKPDDEDVIVVDLKGVSPCWMVLREPGKVNKKNETTKVMDFGRSGERTGWYEDPSHGTSLRVRNKRHDDSAQKRSWVSTMGDGKARDAAFT
jgi:hypothetical protein